MSEPGVELQPLMIIHVYREPDGTLRISEQYYHNYTIEPTCSRKKAFRAFWKELRVQLDWLEKESSHLGWHLTEELAYLRKLRDLGMLSAKKPAETE